MNKYKFRFLIPEEKRGQAFDFVANLKNTDTFKHARFDIYIPNSDSSKIIVCLGQKHTVLRGRVTKFGAKQIAKVQTRLFSYYRYFHHQFNIYAFGAEGVIANGKGNKFKHKDDLLNKYLTIKEKKQLESEDELINYNFVEKTLKRFSLLWYKKLKIYGHDLKYGQQEIAPYASIVSGLRMYSYVAENVIFYPIEGESAYKYVSNKVSENQIAMMKMKKDLHYRSAIEKRGKGLTTEEYDAIIKYNKLVKAFNKAIKSTYREEASLALALENLQQNNVVVFTMGIGHRHNYKYLIPRYLKKKNVSFVLITPPELWWWKHIVSIMLYSVFFLGMIGVFIWYFYM